VENTMTDGLSITWRGKEVRSPAARAACMVFMSIMLLIFVPLMLLFVVALVVAVMVAVMVAFIITLPVHFVLIALGRHGFVTREPDGGASYVVGSRGFKRADHTS
jgi:ABC-type bacteriocin/lantibiotic exporter with double-glycine peptidase domain